MLDTYRFGQKNNWRRRWWNYALGRGRTPDARRVMILPGAEALDVPVLREHGIRDEHIFAIDTEQDVIDAVREKYPRVISIKGDAATMLQAWPKTQPLDAVSMDLKSNLSEASGKVAASLLCSPATWGMRMVPCCITAQRGREVGPYASSISIFKGFAGELPFLCGTETRAPHRALLILAFGAELLKEIADRTGFGDLRPTYNRTSEAGVCFVIGNRAVAGFLEKHSYKSGRIVMDSVFFRLSHSFNIDDAQILEPLRRSVIAHVAVSKRHLRRA